MVGIVIVGVLLYKDGWVGMKFGRVVGDIV